MLGRWNNATDVDQGVAGRRSFANKGCGLVLSQWLGDVGLLFLVSFVDRELHRLFDLLLWPAFLYIRFTHIWALASLLADHGDMGLHRDRLGWFLDRASLEVILLLLFHHGHVRLHWHGFSRLINRSILKFVLDLFLNHFFFID